ncbi:uncharacterized protein TNCV_453321 [Trichonephila clavipes]|nr:uncharacterized protein TNCV_453321 [Trichonephila clavipes]
MTEEKLIDHIISRLEPQILDYVEVRNAQTTSNLLQIIDKFEERFLNRKIRGSSWESRDIQPNENNRFLNRNRQENWRETRDGEMTPSQTLTWERYVFHVSEAKREEFVDDALMYAKSLCEELGTPKTNQEEAQGSKDVQLSYEEDLKRIMFSSIDRVTAEI